ncbi:MAG: type II toxin-antitoxin system Phd/YefM family antitoxin [Pseudomonadota bacterium]
MATVNIHEAKTQFSKLIEAVAQGEEIIIAKAGKPAARLVPVDTPPPVRRPGLMKGKLRIADDFDAPLPEELLAAFEGK